MRIVLSFIFSLLLGSGAFAQMLSFKNYSLEEGLSNSNVTCLLQDDRGYLWVGTLGGGVNRFDGKEIVTYGTREGLSGNEVRSMLLAEDGSLWFGTNAGITVYDGVRFTRLKKDDGLQGTNVLCLYQTADGSIWAGTDDGGVNVISRNADGGFDIRNYDQRSGLSNNFIFDIEQGPDGALWFATFYGGIDRVTPTADSIEVSWLKGNVDIPSELIVCLESDGQGGMWVGSYDKGVFHLRPDDQGVYRMDQRYDNLSEVGDNTIWDILKDRDGQLWIATNSKGLRRLKDGKFTQFTEVNGLPNNQLLSLLQDREGNLWIGTNGNGLARFSGEHFIHFTESAGFFLDQVYSIRQFDDGRLLFSSYGSGIAIQKEVGTMDFEYLNATTGLPGNYVSSVAIDTNQDVWAATENGVVFYNGDYIDTYTEATGLLSNVVNVIEADRMGVVWCGTKYGVSAIAGDRVLNITTDDGLIDNTVTDILEDRAGNIWFATLGGLAKYDRQVLQTFDEVEGLTYKRVNTLAEDTERNIWISTNGGGLFQLDVDSEDSLFIRPVGHDLQRSQSYTDIAFLDEHTLIAGFNRGFDKLTVQDGSIIAVESYDRSDGFRGVETNFNAVYADKQGGVWFGTPIGATYFRPALEPKSDVRPQVHIDDIKLFYQTVDWSAFGSSGMAWSGLPTKLELAHDQKQLTFSFTGIDLGNPEKLRYRHFLEGADEVWSPPQADRQVTYPGLTPGSYVFKVVAIDEDGNESEAASYAFVIKPPWYQTIWFYIACVVLLTMLVFAFIRYRELKLKEEKEYLEKVVAERTTEVVQQKEIIELKNKDITDSINYASRIQEAMLPNMDELKDLFKDSFILFMPKDIVSGDFFWFSQHNGKVFFTASDCTGHGVPGAFMSMIGASLLNDAVNERGLSSPDEVLNEVRQGVIQALSQTGEEGQQKDGMDMALCAYEPDTQLLEFAGANNPLYLVRKGELPLERVTGEVVEAWGETDGVHLYEIKPSKMPVGYYSGEMRPFEAHQLKVQEGDVVYSFSDGYPDQFGGPKGKKFKYAALKQKLIDIHEAPLEKQKEALYNTILAWMGTDQEQIDDICIVGVRI